MNADEASRSREFRLEFDFSAMYGSVEEDFLTGASRLEFRMIPLNYETLEDADGNVIPPSRLEWGYDFVIGFDVENGETELASLAKACLGS